MLKMLTVTAFLWLGAMQAPDTHQFWFFVILMPDHTMHVPTFPDMQQCREVRGQLIGSVVPADALVTECSVHPRSSDPPRKEEETK